MQMTVSLISRLCKFKGICNIQLHIPTMLKNNRDWILFDVEWINSYRITYLVPETYSLKNVFQDSKQW